MKIIYSKKIFYTVIVMFVFAAYAPSFFNFFVWDDYLAVVNNPFVQDFKNLKHLFSSLYLTSPLYIIFMGGQHWGSGEGVYRPVTTLTYFFDFGLWKMHPAGYHFSNIAFHAMASCLVFRFLKFWVKHASAAFIGALVFALHPVQVEAVGVISMRDDMLAGLFYVLTVNLYLESRREGKFRPAVYMAMLASFVLAVFSKEMAFTLPVMLWVIEYFYSGKKFSFRDVFAKRYWGIYLTGLLCLWIWGVVMKKPAGYAMSYPGDSWLVNVMTMLKVMGTYIDWIFNPLLLYHTVYANRDFMVWSFADWSLWGAVIKICFLFVVVAVFCRFIPRLMLAAAWTLLALSPAMNFLPMENIMAARFLYIPFVGAGIAAALVWDKILDRGYLIKGVSITAAKCFLAAVMVYGCVVGYAHQMRLRSDFTFFRHLIDVHPNHEKPRAALSWFYFKQLHEPEKALEQMLMAKELTDDDYYIDAGLGYIYAEMKDWERALFYMEGVVNAQPDVIEFRESLCSFYLKAGKLPEAEGCYAGLIQDKKNVLRAYRNLIRIYGKMGQREKAAVAGFMALWQWQAEKHGRKP